MTTIVNTEFAGSTIIHTAAAAVQGATGLDGGGALAVVLFAGFALAGGLLTAVGATLERRPRR